MMTIQVIQGPGTTKKFGVHRGVLCFHSDFFNRSLNGAFKESGSYSYDVKDCKMETFQVFYDWINTGVQFRKLSSQQAIDLFVFADFYAVPVLKNRALEAFHRYAYDQWEIDFEVLQSVYLQTVKNSSLRKLAMDGVVETWSFQAIEENLSGVPEECLLDMLQACSLKRFVGGSETGGNSLDIGKYAWDNKVRTTFCDRYHDHNKAEYHGACASVRSHPSMLVRC